MERIEPVQIIGTQRSGSNLLRLMLNQIEGVFAPHPPHIINTFYQLLPGYGDLEEDDNFMSLIDDVCTLVELNPVPWENLLSNRVEICKECKNRSLSEIFRIVYELNARRHKAHIWICKSMQNVKYLNYFELNGLKPKIIYLFRDGRDVALSFKKAIVGPKHIFCIAKKWKEEQELSLKVIDEKDDTEAMFLSYESLVHEPEKQLHRVCKFLNIPYSKQVMNFYTSDESLRTANAGEMWANLKSPIIKGNTNKFIREMNEDEIEMFEHEGRRVLNKLGYSLMHEDSEDTFRFSENDKKSFEKINQQMQIEMMRKAPLKDLRNRGAQDDFVKELKRKLKIKAA